MFPLLLLLIVETDRVVVTLVPNGQGTRIIVVGEGRPDYAASSTSSAI